MNGDADDYFDEDFYEDVDSDIQTIISNISLIDLQFGEWNVDAAGYETALRLQPLDDIALDPETPLSPIVYTPLVELSVSAEEFVRRVVLLLEGLSANERFYSVKRRSIRDPFDPIPHPIICIAAVQILREIALAEQERRPTRLTRRLILEVADLLSTMLKVRAVEDVTLVTATGESILTRWQNFMLKVERDVKDCARLINLYHSRGNVINALLLFPDNNVSPQAADGTR